MVLEEDRFVGTEGLQEWLTNGDVKLLRGKWLLEHWHVLKDLNRQQLEERHPDAFAGEVMIQRLVKEAGAARVENMQTHKCVYPGVVVISHCWQTSTHPDPTGSMLEMLSRQLRWYAAQRCKYAPSRLYADFWYAGLKKAEWDWDFGVMLDFWSLFQPPRTAEQEASFKRAQAAMCEWFGHAGTVKFLLREAPSSWQHSQPFAERGGYFRRGWCCFEAQSALLGGARHCLDMAGFEEMLEGCSPATQEQLTAQEIRHELSQPTSRFELEDLAMEDKDGKAQSEGSCLRPLVVKRQWAPVPPGEMEEELRTRAFTDAADMRVCVEGYGRAATAAMARATELMLVDMQHWEDKDWARVGRCLAHYTQLKGVHFVRSKVGDTGLRAFLNALEKGYGGSITFLALSDSGITDGGMAALAEAVKKGCMPQLRALYGVPHGEGELDERATRRVWAAAGKRVSVEWGTVSLKPAGLLSACCAAS